MDYDWLIVGFGFKNTETGFPVRYVVDSIPVDQPVPGTAVASFARLCVTVHTSLTQFFRIEKSQERNRQ